MHRIEFVNANEANVSKYGITPSLLHQLERKVSEKYEKYIRSKTLFLPILPHLRKLTLLSIFLKCNCII